VDEAAPGGDAISSGVWCESSSARAAIGAAIEVSVRRILAELPRARAGGDPEGVHQARVATRRLRSDLRTFGRLIDDEWRTDTRSELKRLADALGSVRDHDVLQIRIADAADAAGIEPDALAPIVDVLTDEQRTMRRALVDVIDEDRTSDLLDVLQRAATDPPTTAAALGRAERRLKPLVRRPWQKLTKSIAELDEDPSADELHRVRLLTKRARYSAEAVVPVFGRDARRFAAALGQIQDVLGEMNDAEVALRWLSDHAPDLDPSVAFTAGRLAQHFVVVADLHRHGWERAVGRASKRSEWLD
jgi:CHAD domain-containing protein